MQIRLWRDVTGKPLEDDDTLEALTNRLLNTLTPREEKVLRARYGLFDGRERTLEEIGQDFGVTRERIRQIQAKALRKLNHPSRRRRIERFFMARGLTVTEG